MREESAHRQVAMRTPSIVVSAERYLYFDKRCADDSAQPAWLLGGKPSVQRDSDLNEHDGAGCENDFRLETDKKLQAALEQYDGKSIRA